MITPKKIKREHYHSTRDMLLWAIGACPSRSDQQKGNGLPKKALMEEKTDQN